MTKKRTRPTPPVTASTPPTTTDPVLHLVDQITATIEQYQRLDEETTRRNQTIPNEVSNKYFKDNDIVARADMAAAQRARGLTELDFHSDKVTALHHGLEGAMACTRATSLEGALAQLALAHDRVGLAEMQSDDDDQKDAMREAARLLSSAVMAIEAATGAKRPQVFGEYYMNDDYSPFTRERDGKKAAG